MQHHCFYHSSNHHFITIALNTQGLGGENVLPMGHASL